MIVLREKDIEACQKSIEQLKEQLKIEKNEIDNCDKRMQ